MELGLEHRPLYSKPSLEELSPISYRTDKEVKTQGKGKA